MKTIKYLFLGLMLAMVVIQFIRPEYNKSDEVSSVDFAKVYKVPEDIKTIIKNACYDCHSNNTRYPWYSKVQPIAWMMRRHITNGKQELNFSEFGNYSTRRKISKLKGIANSIKDDDMPLTSYKLMHGEAKLSDSTKSLLVVWADKNADSLSKNDQ